MACNRVAAVGGRRPWRVNRLSRSASARPMRRAGRDRRLLLLAGGVELLEVGPQIGGLLLVLDAGEHHLGPRYLGPRILDVFLERRLVPGNAGVLVGLAVSEPFDGAGLASVE